MNRIVFVVMVALLPLLGMSQVLNYQEVHLDNLSGVDGIDGGYGVVVSPDSQHVYAVGSADKAVTLFHRLDYRRINLCAILV